MFEIFKSEKSGDYRFRLKARNGQIILTSQGYKTKRSCLNGIESVRKNSCTEKCIEWKQGKNGKYHFHVIARNGEIVGSSQMYKTKRTMQIGIESVKKNSPEGALRDLSE